MAIDGTYTGLQSSVASWLRRSDLTTTIPDFIALAEAKMNRRLRCQDMEFIKTFSISQETTSLPCALLSVSSFKIAYQNVTGKLYYRSPAKLDEMTVGFMATPQFYTIAGGRLVFYPIPDQTYQVRMIGRQAIPALSVANSTNWLLQKHPDAYLYGALLGAAPYLKNDERIETWGGLFEKVLADIEAADRHLVSDQLQTQSDLTDRST